MKTFENVKNDFIESLENCYEKALLLAEEYNDDELENDYLKMIAETVLDQIEYWKDK